MYVYVNIYIYIHAVYLSIYLLSIYLVVVYFCIYLLCVCVYSCLFIYIYMYIYIYMCIIYVRIYIYIYMIYRVNSLNNYSVRQNQKIKDPNWNLQLLGHSLAYAPSEGQRASQVSKNPPV